MQLAGSLLAFAYDRASEAELAHAIEADLDPTGCPTFIDCEARLPVGKTLDSLRLRCAFDRQQGAGHGADRRRQLARKGARLAAVGRTHQRVQRSAK
jgi:hypothetical protein